MSETRKDLVRIDSTGTAHPVGRQASRDLRARQGAFRLMPAPNHLVVMRFVGEDGKRDAEDGAVFRLAGEIASAGALCDVVGLIAQAAWKGELAVIAATGESRSVFFDNGHVISATSRAEGERLGDVLYRYGALTEEQVRAASAAVTGEVRFGQAAVKLGFIAREDLFQLMAKQTEEIFYALLLVSDGMFYFLDGYDEARLPSHLHLSVNSLLMEGVRRMDETRYFRDRIPSEHHVPVRVPDKAPPEEEPLRKVWDAIDGSSSVEVICRAVGQGEFEVTHALFQLVQNGKVVVQAPRLTGPQEIVARFNEAIALLLGNADEIGLGEEVRGQLSSFGTGAGVYDPLFLGAGPGADGTLEPARLVQNAQMLVGPDCQETLAQWLHEYASFALFVLEPALRTGGKEQVARKAAELIAPLAGR
jgi:hypothetical protein